MLTVNTHGQRRSTSIRLALAGLAGLAFLMAAGCCGPAMTSEYADQGKTQVQFYSPPGATVTVRACPTRSREIAEYGPFSNRLEQTPEEFSVFNLAPGRYEFKYTSAEGLPGVSLYGELEVKHANGQAARLYQRRSFVPVSLPSEHYRRVVDTAGDEIFPYRGESFRTAIDELDILRLRQGDVVEKVFVVADLEDAEEELLETERDLAVNEREMDYAEARYRDAYYDFKLDVGDSHAAFWGTDRKFIKWEARRQELRQKADRLAAKLERLRNLLGADPVHRSDMLVVTTEEIAEARQDAEVAGARIGEVMLIMRIGGRHMHWGEPSQELTAWKD